MGNTITIDPSNPYEGLKALEDEQLKELAAAAHNVVEARKSEKQKDAMEQIRRLAAENGLQVDVAKADAGNKAGKTRQPLPPMYANPENSEQTWSGRGARPKWFKKALEEGKSADDMKI